jgi:hypothetical protein
MATLDQKQRVARENSKKSTGPRTDAGKQRCAQNPIKHGFASKRVVLTNEDQSAFDQTLAGFREDLKPVGNVEDSLVIKMVNSYWRLSRLWAMETAMMDAAMMSQAGEFEATFSPHHPALRAMDAFSFLALENPVALTTLDRYETRFDRCYHKSLDALLKLQRKRNAPQTNLSPLSRPAARPVPEQATVVPKPSITNPILRYIAALLTWLMALITKPTPVLPSRVTPDVPSNPPTPREPLRTTFPAQETFEWWALFTPPIEKKPDA